MAVSVKQPPITPDSTFAAAFPGLVEGFDQVVIPAILLGLCHKTANELGFIDSAWQRRFALTAFARPASLADQNVFGRKFAAKHLTDLRDMVECLIDTGRIIFPIRQQVNGQEVDSRGNLRVLQPKLPHVSVSDRLFDLPFDLLDQLDQLWGGDFFAQQHFVADDQGAYDVWIGIGRGDQGADFFLRVEGVAVNPSAAHDFQTMLAGQIRQGFKARL